LKQAFEKFSEWKNAKATILSRKFNQIWMSLDKHAGRQSMRTPQQSEKGDPAILNLAMKTDPSREHHVEVVAPVGVREPALIPECQRPKMLRQLK
jgi:hypothetical protein